MRPFLVHTVELCPLLCQDHAPMVLKYNLNQHGETATMCCACIGGFCALHESFKDCCSMSMNNVLKF